VLSPAVQPDPTAFGLLGCLDFLAARPNANESGFSVRLKALESDLAAKPNAIEFVFATKPNPILCN
jgi:hypothetical protein